MSKAINQLKELYLLSNIALCDRDLNVPDYQTKTVYGLLECINDYRAFVNNPKQFQEFIEFFEKNVIEEGGPDER